MVPGLLVLTVPLMVTRSAEFEEPAEPAVRLIAPVFDVTKPPIATVSGLWAVMVIFPESVETLDSIGIVTAP